MHPSYTPGIHLTDSSLCLPEFVTTTLRDAILQDEADGTYDTTWVLDHFDGTTFEGGDRDLLEAFTFMGALARASPGSRGLDDWPPGIGFSGLPHSRLWPTLENA